MSLTHASYPYHTKLCNQYLTCGYYIAFPLKLELELEVKNNDIYRIAFLSVTVPLHTPRPFRCFSLKPSFDI